MLVWEAVNCVTDGGTFPNLEYSSWGLTRMCWLSDWFTDRAEHWNQWTFPDSLRSLFIYFTFQAGLNATQSMLWEADSVRRALASFNTFTCSEKSGYAGSPACFCALWWPGHWKSTYTCRRSVIRFLPAITSLFWNNGFPVLTVTIIQHTASWLFFVSVCESTVFPYSTIVSEFDWKTVKCWEVETYSDFKKLHCVSVSFSQTELNNFKYAVESLHVFTSPFIPALLSQWDFLCLKSSYV